MMTLRTALLASATLFFAATGAANAALTISSVQGGAPTGVTLDNLNWLSLGVAGGLSPQSGITVNFTPNAQAVQGSVSGQYAAPFLSGSNGIAFGDPIGTDQPTGVNTTTYITAGSTGSVAAAAVELLLPGQQLYFGLLWGSIDDYNTLSFFNGEDLVGSITGADVTATPTGNQGPDGTRYVNITSTVGFDRVVATSSQFAFEFDNIAFNPTVPVPAPAALGLFGVGLLGLAFATRRRRA